MTARIASPENVPESSSLASPNLHPLPIAFRLLSDKQDEKTYCLTEKCSQRVKRCLTNHAPVASLVSGRATARLSFHKSMLTDVGPVELWATPLRRPSAAANPQGSSRRLGHR